jgi:hypothetical protein
MYICIYVYVYMYMYICIYVYMYICVYVYMYICICKNAHTMYNTSVVCVKHASLCIAMYEYVHICMHIHRMHVKLKNLQVCKRVCWPPTPVRPCLQHQWKPKKQWGCGWPLFSVACQRRSGTVQAALPSMCHGMKFADLAWRVDVIKTELLCAHGFVQLWIPFYLTMTRIVVLSPIPLLHMLSSNSAKREFLCLNVVPDM